MATTVLDLITQAYVEINQTEPGASPSSTEQTLAFNRLNQILGQLGTEGLTAYTQVSQAFTVGAGITSYTLGTGGSLSTSARAQKITGWKATSGVFAAGGPALAFADFDAQAQAAAQAFQVAAANVAQAQAALAAQTQQLMAPFNQIPAYSFPLPGLLNSAVPMLLGADTSYPSINVRIFPAITGTCSLELAYWTIITKFATTGDTISLPDGWEQMLKWLLAADLLPVYPRQDLDVQVILGNAQAAKASIVSQNQMAQPPAPQKQTA